MAEKLHLPLMQGSTRCSMCHCWRKWWVWRLFLKRKFGTQLANSVIDREVLTKWEDLSEFEATWECLDNINQHFSSFHLRGKVAVWEGGNARTSPKAPSIITYARRPSPGMGNEVCNPRMGIECKGRKVSKGKGVGVHVRGAYREGIEMSVIMWLLNVLESFSGDYHLSKCRYLLLFIFHLNIYILLLRKFCSISIHSNVFTFTKPARKLHVHSTNLDYLLRSPW